MIDATKQIRGRLPISAGGTGNLHGHARGTVLPCAYFPGDYASGGTGTLAYGALVRLNGSWPTVTQTSDTTDRAMGVCIGSFNVNGGEITTGVAVAAGDTAAILITGVTDVLFDAPASAGQFVSPAATDGHAVAGTGFRLNAIGLLMEAVSGAGVLGKVLVVNVLGSLSAGASTDVHASFFGAASAAGAIGLMADAGHEHEREPDISALRTPTAVASSSSHQGSQTADLAIDSNPSTYWSAQNGTAIAGEWVKVDLGIPRQIVSYSLAHHATSGFWATSFKVQSSDDGSSWTDRAQPTGVGASIAAQLSHVVTARYWRFLAITGGGLGPWQVNDVDLRAVPYGPLDASTGLIPAEFLPTPGSIALEDLSNVDMSGVADGDVPTWDAGSSTWLPGAAGGSLAFEDLTDVDMSGLADGDVPVWDAGSSTWLPGSGGGGGGADVNDHFVVAQGGEGDTDLSNRVVIPGLSASPDIRAGGGSDLEFDSSTIGGTALGSPTTIDANTTAKSHLYIRKTSASGFALHGRYWSKSPAFTVSAKLTGGTPLGTNYMRIGMGITEATPGKTEGIYWEQNTNTPPRVVSSISSTSPSAGAAYVTTGGWGEFLSHLPVYFRCVVVSSTDITWKWSYDGLIWRRLGSANRNPGFTIASVFLAVDAENTSYDIEAIFDWLRFA